MAVVPTVTFNGNNIATTYGLYLQAGTKGWRGAAPVKVESDDLVGRVGSVLSDTDTIPGHTKVLNVQMTATTLAALDGFEDALLALYRTSVTVRFADGTNTREFIGRLVGVELDPYKIPLSVRMDGRLSFFCADPLWRATSTTNEAITGTPNAIALGTAPVSDWVLTITATTNSITDITITLGPDTLTYTGTIAAGQALVIDASDHTVENNGTDDRANYTGGFPVVDPRDTPSVSASKDSGSGTLGGSLVFYARYY